MRLSEVKLPALNRRFLVRAIVRGYFLAALAGSFHNLIHAGLKGGLGGEAMAIPFMVDGVAVVGILMRHPSWSAHTRKVGLGFITFGAALSLVGNVYAALNVGQALFGAGLVGFYLAGEIFSSPKHLQPVQVDVDRAAVVEAARIAAEVAARKAESTAKGQRTKARNRRAKAAQQKLIEEMVNGD